MSLGGIVGLVLFVGGFGFLVYKLVSKKDPVEGDDNVADPERPIEPTPIEEDVTADEEVVEEKPKRGRPRKKK